MTTPVFDLLNGVLMMHAHTEIPAAVLQDTRANILAASAATVRFAVATDQPDMYGGYEVFLANGSNWYELPARLYIWTAPDMGVYQDSVRNGYGPDYVTDKRLSNVSVGENATTTTGAIRFNATTLKFQIYYSGAWNNAVTGFTFTEGTDGHLKHTPVSFTETVDVFSGNGQTLGLNNLPSVQQHQASMGAYPVPLQIDGGDDALDNPASINQLLNRTIFQLRLRRDTWANLIKTATYYLEGELAYPTDKTGRLYIGNSTNYASPVQTLDMAVCHDDAVVCNNNEIVYSE